MMMIMIMIMSLFEPFCVYVPSFLLSPPLLVLWGNPGGVQCEEGSPAHLVVLLSRRIRRDTGGSEPFLQ